MVFHMLNQRLLGKITSQCLDQRSHCRCILALGLPDKQALLPRLMRTVRRHTGDGDFADADLLALARSCPDVFSIDLSSCPKITDAGLGKLVQHCPQLHPDKIKSYVKGDVFLNSLAKHWPQLQSIGLAHCNKVTDVGVGELAKHCPNCTVTR